MNWRHAAGSGLLQDASLMHGSYCETVKAQLVGAPATHSAWLSSAVSVTPPPQSITWP